MHVVVSRAYRHQTPVFAKDMQFVVFRPYWNVPLSIQRSETVPAIQRDPKVFILYGTSVIEEDGEMRFFDDIYGYDRALEKVLKKGYSGHTLRLNLRLS
jgi:murein L,D-transpeptidase YcbB/YkuD